MRCVTVVLNPFGTHFYTVMYHPRPDYRLLSRVYSALSSTPDLKIDGNIFTFSEYIRSLWFSDDIPCESGCGFIYSYDIWFHLLIF